MFISHRIVVAVCFLLGTVSLVGRSEEPRAIASKPRGEIKVPIRAWFQPAFVLEKPELYNNMTMVTSLADANAAQTLRNRGVITLRWCYGPNSPWSEGKKEYYLQQSDPVDSKSRYLFDGVGVDEWNTGDGNYEKEKQLAALGFRAASEKWPDSLRVAFVTMPDPLFVGLVKEHVFDLAIIEAYSFIPDVGGLTLEEICKRCDVMKEAGLLDRTIVCLGFVSAAKDKQGRAMTIEELERQARYIKKRYPDMPGIAFYGYEDESPATIELIRKADNLGAQLYPNVLKDDR